MIKQFYITAIIVAAEFRVAGMMTVNYTELKERDITQAPDYTPGRNTCTFNLIK